MPTETAPPPVAATPPAVKPSFESVAEQMLQPQSPDAQTQQTEAPPPRQDTTPPKPEFPATESKPEKKSPEKKTSIFDKKPKAVEASAPTDPYAAIEAPAGISEKGAKSWQEFKAKATKEYQTVAQERESLRQQLELHKKAAPADVTQLESLRAEHKAALDKLAVFDVQSHPEFQKSYIAPKKAAIAEAQNVLAYSGVEGVDIPGLLGKDQKTFNAAVSAITKDMNTMDAQTVQTSLRQAFQIAGKEKEALSGAGELQKQLQAQTAQRQRDSFVKLWEENGPKDLEDMEVPEGASPERAAKIQAYNQGRATIRQKAEEYAFSKLDDKGAATLATKAATLDFMLGHAVPMMESEFAELRELARQQHEELVAIRGSKDPGTFSASNGNEPDPARETLQQTADRLLRPQ